MKILGLHFGHDAGVSLVEDGKVVFLAHCERLTRIKRATGIRYQDLMDIFDRAGLKATDFDHCAITSTQGVDIILDRRHPFSIDLVRHPDDMAPSLYEALAIQKGVKTPADFSALFDPLAADTERREKRIADTIGGLGIPPHEAVCVPMLNRYWFGENSPIDTVSGLKNLARDWHLTQAGAAKHRHSLHYPITVHLDGHTIPGSMINHHAAHAGATFYQSPFSSAAIFTLDGGANIHEGGLFWYGTGNEIWPVRTHLLRLGSIYLAVANTFLKLGGSAEGKMMGLAPYGEPVFFKEEFITNAGDTLPILNVRGAWINHLIAGLRADPARYEPGTLGDPSKMTTPINADVAASTQKLFEETMIEAVNQLSKLLGILGLERNRIALSGGCMLNCPTNSRISQETEFKDVFVEPACDDGGLPSGAALWAYHNVLGEPRTPGDPARSGGLPYLGLPLRTGDVKLALARYGDKIRMSRPKDIAAEGARRLVHGQVLGWFQGRSEIGPRALGHRSIVADPRSASTWERVNTIKGRELWRPLAPSVLEEHSAEFFKNMPARSPFMMFVGDVIRDDIPAICHIDNTARVQTVSPECGRYYDLIRAFHELTDCAVVLNTSMNGPGEPIAEYPADAIAILLNGRFDALVLEDMLIERAA